ALAAPRAAMLEDLEGAVGAEAVALRLLRLARTLGRGRARADDDAHRGVDRQRLGRLEGGEASLGRGGLRGLGESADVEVGGALRGGGAAHAHRVAAGLEEDGARDRLGVDLLIEGDEERRLERLGVALRVAVAQLRRRR